MTGLTYLLVCLLYFVCVGLDVALFFLQIRLIQQLKTVHWLVSLDNIGEPLVSAITAKVFGTSKFQAHLSEKGKLVVSVVIFAIARIVLGTILKVT